MAFNFWTQKNFRLKLEAYPSIDGVSSFMRKTPMAQVLTQILLDYDPVKLDMFSNELLTRAIRVNDRLLKNFVDV